MRGNVDSKMILDFSLAKSAECLDTTTQARNDHDLNLFQYVVVFFATDMVIRECAVVL